MVVMNTFFIKDLDQPYHPKKYYAQHAMDYFLKHWMNYVSRNIIKNLNDTYRPTSVFSGAQGPCAP
jgi:hypothetical protein